MGCGDSQYDKNHKDEMCKLKKEKWFEFPFDQETNILRNVKYHAFLNDEKERQNKSHKK